MESAMKELKKKRKDYAKDWSVDAEKFTNNKDYEWMESLIQSYTKIVEIGCGDGSSTLELCSKGHNVISIDENIECLKLTKDKLEGAGYSVSLIKREHLLVLHEKRYKINYSKIKYEISKDSVLLIEGDIIEDGNLLQWLKNNKPYDAIVCWLIGSHGYRIFNDVVSERKLSTPGDYRFAVQNSVYEVADELLRSQGALQIIDRGKTPEEDNVKEDLMESHRDQASVTSLIVSSLEYRKYDTNIDNGTRMNMSIGSDVVFTDKMTDMSFISVISIKP